MDINNFGPFNSEVWGSVSDWVMVIVTAITLYFLMRNLKSQLIIEKTSLKATLIENERYRNEILPAFSIKAKKNKLYKEDDFVTQEIIFDFWLKQNECKYLKVKVTPALVPSSKVEIQILPGSLEYLVKDAHRLIKSKLVTERKVFDLMGSDLTIRMSFEDTIGNKYYQEFIFYTDYSNTEIIDLDPFRII